MPLGLDVTVPDPWPPMPMPIMPMPPPPSITVTVKVNRNTSNVAVQLRAASIVTLVVCELPPQSPLQPANVDPLAASADSVTTVPVS